MTKRLAGRVALITGASRGIGRAVALRLAMEGAHVVLLARTVGALEEVDDEIQAAGGTATLIPQDLARLDELEGIGPSLYTRFGRMDILVANAGLLGVLSPLAHTPTGIWDQTMAVNVHASHRLIRSLDPLLRASDAGRAIFVTSGAGQTPRAYWSIYAVSKAALTMMAKIYAEETIKTNVRVNLVSPGAVRTRMRGEAFPGEDPMTVKTPESVTDLFLELADPECKRHGEILSPA